MERLQAQRDLFDGVIARVNSVLAHPTAPELLDDLDGYSDMAAAEYARLAKDAER